MSILINHDTKLIVQGTTGRDGGFRAIKVRECGISMVDGTSPGKVGQEAAGIPVSNTIKDIVKATGANTSVIFVSTAFAKDAILEAINAGIQLIICVTEGVPTLDVVGAYRCISGKGAKLIGPNCPGLISPEESIVGTMPANIFRKRHTGVINHNGTLTYQVVADLTAAGFGQFTAVGVGGDPIVGLYFQNLLEMFQNDPETNSIALIGKIGGNAEKRAADYIRQHTTKPVVAFISGREAPKGKQIGYAGAIISGGSGTAAERIAVSEAAGVSVAHETCEVPALLKERM